MGCQRSNTCVGLELQRQPCLLLDKTFHRQSRAGYGREEVELRNTGRGASRIPWGLSWDWPALNSTVVLPLRCTWHWVLTPTVQLPCPQTCSCFLLLTELNIYSSERCSDPPRLSLCLVSSLTSLLSIQFQYCQIFPLIFKDPGLLYAFKQWIVFSYPSYLKLYYVCEVVF